MSKDPSNNKPDGATLPPSGPNSRVSSPVPVLPPSGPNSRGPSPIPMLRNSTPPTNRLVTPLLTDLYQITMTYAYWKAKRHDDEAVFELFFRKNPFGGEYTIFCGIDEVLKYASTFKFSKSDLDYLRSTPTLAHCDPEFFDNYLANLDCSSVKIYAMEQGRMVFPRLPLLTVVGPLGISQLLETTLLTLINYPSLVATNAARMVVAAKGQTDENHHHSTGCKRRGSRLAVCDTLDAEELPIRMAEFGLRRAQGPDGGFSASKYSMIGGFDGTSNVQAGKLLGVPIVGTHAHAYVQTYSSLEDVKSTHLLVDGKEETLLPRVLKYRNEVFGADWKITNDGELAAFISYAAAFPNTFLCLVDTYDTLQSGVKNFILVALVLHDLGHTPKGIRLDSGDLAYLSIECAKLFKQIAEKFDLPFFRKLDIVASSDINENVIYSLTRQGHAINVFGIGTNLVTCEGQPALGCVYKLVEINGKPRMKISQSIEKVLIPGRKEIYRLYGEAGWPLLDILIGKDDSPPKVGERIVCRHPFIERKRVAVVPKIVVKLHNLVFDGKRGVVFPCPTIEKSKELVADEIKVARSDILRYVNPTDYKVSVTENLFRHLHSMWQAETPVMELR